MTIQTKFKQRLYDYRVERGWLYRVYTGQHNVAIGASALVANTTGHHNVAIGTGAICTPIVGQLLYDENTCQWGYVTSGN